LASSAFPAVCPAGTGFCDVDPYIVSYPHTNPALPLIGGGTIEIDPTAPVDLSRDYPVNGVGGNAVFGNFSATALTPAASFIASGGATGHTTGASIQVQGTLALASTGSLFVPSTDDVVFGFGPYTAFIPAGSFTQSAGTSTFSGNVNGSPVQITLTNTSGRTYTYSIAVQNANLTTLSTPSVDLYIGDNAASGTPSPIAQAITFGTLPSSLAMGATVTLSATSSSGLAVTFSTPTPSVCAVSGTTVTGVVTGTCTIAASQVGNGIYAAAPPVQRSFPVVSTTQQAQVIEFPPIHDRSLSEDREFTVYPRASSGLPVTLSSLTNRVCSIVGSHRVLLLATGICSLRASQPGNAQFAPATPVERSFKVLLGDN
jgi:hypothetical protein